MKDFCSFVAELLQRAGYRTCEFATGESALSAARSERPAAVVLDIHLPDVSGYEVCRELRASYENGLAILFVSGVRTEGFDRAAGLIVGADDYLVKPIDPGELIARLRRLVKPRRSSAGKTAGSGRLEALTPREREVLELLSDGYRQEEIAGQLVISPKTVATHIQRVLNKLNVRSRAQAIAIALRDGRDVRAHRLVDLTRLR
jgi:DNA-binding NarL/FixJ family response regulator